MDKDFAMPIKGDEIVLNKTYLTKRNKTSFAIAGGGQNLIIGMVNTFLMFFYTDVFLLPIGFVTALMLAARLFDAFNDPFMGLIVDKTRTKYGKLRPYILISAFPIGLLTCLLFIVPDFANDYSKMVYASITYILFGVFYTVCDVPFWGLASAMTPNSEEREKMISFSRIIHSIGGASPIFLVPLFIMIFNDNDEKGFMFAGIFAGVIGSMLFLKAFFGTEERTVLSEKTPTIAESFSYLVRNKPLLRVVLSNIIGFTRAMPFIASIYIATYLLGNSTYNIFIIIAWGGGGAAGLIFTPKITKIISYNKIYMLSAIYCTIASLIMLLVCIVFSGTTMLILLLLCLIIVGLAYGICTNINYAMIADSVDYMEWKTGERVEGVTVSLQTLMNKTMTALQTSLLGILLIIIKFAQPIKNSSDEIITQVQSDNTILGFVLIITAVPVIGWILSGVMMSKYNFIGEMREEAQRDILLAREVKIAALEERLEAEEKNDNNDNNYSNPDGF